MVIPAPFRYALAVSRRTPVACSMRRSGQPSRPKARICCRLSSPKILAMPTGEHGLIRRVNVLGRGYLTGRFSDVHDWPVLGVHRGFSLDEINLFTNLEGPAHPACSSDREESVRQFHVSRLSDLSERALASAPERGAIKTQYIPRFGLAWGRCANWTPLARSVQVL